MGECVIRIPREASVLALDDMEHRLEWFQKRIPNIVCVSTVDDAIMRIADQRPPFDLIFLDHDLGTIETGEEVARHLASNGFIGYNVVIHSWNSEGAKRMKNLLNNAAAITFGNFEIELT